MTVSCFHTTCKPFPDLQVARILGVTPELKVQMGVSSGLELVTLPHGRQLRLDLMERYRSQVHRTHSNTHDHMN